MMKERIKACIYSILDLLPEKMAVQLYYLKSYHRLPDLKNPVTFGEKVAWRKLNQRNPLFTRCADKIAVKDVVAEAVGREYLIDTLWTGDRPEDIPFSQLQPPYVIKTARSCGGHIFIRSAEHAADTAWIISTMKQHMRSEHGRRFREWGYYNIPQRIIIERMMQAEDSDAVPEDYKIFVYHGRALYIQRDQGRYINHRRAFFDRDWNKLDATVAYPLSPDFPPPPPQLAEMLQVAEKLGAPFDFVRVDLYLTSEGLKFGEMTFYPGAGIDPFYPQHWNEDFGAPWQLPLALERKGLPCATAGLIIPNV